MSNSSRPHGLQPTRLLRPWDFPGKSTGVGCHFLLQCVKVKVKSLSHVQLFETPWTAAYQPPPSVGFSRQDYWSGVPLPSLQGFPVLHHHSELAQTQVHRVSDAIQPSHPQSSPLFLASIFPSSKLLLGFVLDFT